jgi:hypothetical protein
VRSVEEILATLDDRGSLGALPFTPEMHEFCGQQFRISGVAHKTCDSATFSGGRRMRDAVFLEDLILDVTGQYMEEVKPHVFSFGRPSG